MTSSTSPATNSTAPDTFVQTFDPDLTPLGAQVLELLDVPTGNDTTTAPES
jgi:hypothetical protein